MTLHFKLITNSGQLGGTSRTANTIKMVNIDQWRASIGSFRCRAAPPEDETLGLNLD